MRADEPLQMGLSSRTSSSGLDDGQVGFRQHPEALRKFAFSTLDFHHFFAMSPTQENGHDWQEQPCFEV